MPLQTSDFIAFGSIVIAVLTYVKARRKTVTWCLFAIGIGALLVSVFSRTNESGKTINQQATASGQGTVYQAAGNQTFNSGMSEEFVRELLKEKALAANEELARRYPAGFVILGIANGKLVYESRPSVAQLSVDWGSAKLRIDGTNAAMRLPDFTITDPRRPMTVVIRGALETFPFVENAPYKSRMFTSIGFEIYFEVLDVSKSVFIVGFKEVPLPPRPPPSSQP